jgi:signal transduction histidine kinase
MTTSRDLRASSRLLLLLLLLAAVPLSALGWLGWRLLDQDRALERQRVRERLVNDAGLLSAESERALAGWEALLAGGQRSGEAAPPQGIFIVFGSRGVLRREGIPLPYYPEVDLGGEPVPTVFAEAEMQEFRGGGPGDAAAAYRKLAASADRRQRAGALVGLARCLRKQHDIRGALRAYEELTACGGTMVAGAPAELLALTERAALLRETGDTAAAQRETRLLAEALGQGRYPIDHATFEFYSQAAGGTLKVDGCAAEVARTVEAIWPRLERRPSGRLVVEDHQHAFAAVWQPSADGTAAIVGNAATLLAPVVQLAQKLQVRAAFEVPGGQTPAGDPVGAGEQVSKSYRETGLPWTIRVSPADTAQSQADWKARRNLFGAGFGLMGLVIAAATYLAFRAVHRELAVARLQSDFVSAVSHEFRTPLAAMCHLTEMLEEGGAPQNRVPEYYRALGRETRRLHAMVESLLDFGRMESGKRTYRMEETNAAALVRGVVEEFRERPDGLGERLAFDAPQDSFTVRADREAISLALRNLVDNALKYSPESTPVSISVARRGDLAEISVEDQGPGIPKGEQREVFRKFVRGEAARARNVKGTGIGLALADHIVKTHGGRLELASEPGHGSRFTILLPAQPGEQ